ncbi:MAG: MarR family winged helix-turn-helix transcriptional regulator [Pseudomonadota bacterium]
MNGPSVTTGSGAARQPAASKEPKLTDVGLDGFAPYLINRISARYNADMAAALRERGLTTAQMRALAVLAVHPGLTINELAVFAVMEQSTMSRTLDAMAEGGLVERRPREEDGRVREVVLTAAGETAFRDVWPLMRGEEERMFEDISQSDRAAFMMVLSKILRNIRRHPI